MVKQLVVFVIVFAVLLCMSIYLTEQLFNFLPTPSDTQAQDVINHIKDTTWVVYRLLPLVLLVLVVYAIISSLMGQGNED